MPLQIGTAAEVTPPEAGMQIRVEVAIQVHQRGEEPASLDEMDQSVSPERLQGHTWTTISTRTTDATSTSTATINIPDRWTHLQVLQGSRDECLLAIAEDAVRGCHTGMTYIFPQTPASFRVFDLDEATLRADRSLKKILAYGERLLSVEKAEDHAASMCDTGLAVDVPVDVWLETLAPIRTSDRPLFFILRDSIYPHTPYPILRRWAALYRSMKEKGQTIESITRRAEYEPRIKWDPLVLQFYFLMLDHSAALKVSAPRLTPQLGSLQMKLSALTTALRFHYYLVRMTRDHRLRCAKSLKRHLHRTGVYWHMKELYGLVGQEFGRMQDPPFGHFHSTERALCGQRIKIEDITKFLEMAEKAFCSICQDEHPGSESVRPLKCRCTFGRNCLESMLNRDIPFSNACPNCRSPLHAPLQWRSIVSPRERDLYAKLLWALRTSMLDLKKDINTDPKPFTVRQRIQNWLYRLCPRLDISRRLSIFRLTNQRDRQN